MKRNSRKAGISRMLAIRGIKNGLQISLKPQNNFSRAIPSVKSWLRKSTERGLRVWMRSMKYWLHTYLRSNTETSRTQIPNRA